MGKDRRTRIPRHAEVAYRNSQQATESLPFPIVFYPGHYGTFLGFASADAPNRICLCSCAEPAVANFLVLRGDRPRNVDSLRKAPLDSAHFPLEIASRSNAVDDVWVALEFVPGLCHRCNLARPSLNYCHPMYGGQFIQGFGWYVNQAFYRLGVEPRPKWTGTSAEPVYLGHSVLDEACPEEVRELVHRETLAATEYRHEFDRLLAMARGPDRDDIAPDEITFWHNVKIDESTDFVRIRRQAAQAERAVTTFIENQVRREFGFRKVGEGWVSETLLSQLVARLLSAHEVLRHYRPDWLEGLELDIFVPDLLLGIEYQGQQHFHAIEAWGGAQALARVQHNDAKKAVLCELAGVTLLTVDYTEPLTEAHVGALIGARIDVEPA